MSSAGARLPPVTSISAALPLIAALTWTVALLIDAEPFGQVSALLVGVGLLGLSSVSVIGMVLTGGRWAHRLALAAVTADLVIAVLRPVDIVWLVALTVSALSAGGLFHPRLTYRIRRLPSADGPPPGAVLAPLALLVVPFALGVTPGESTTWAILVVGLSAPVSAFLFARVISGGLLVIRVIWPLLALGLAPVIGGPAGLTGGVLGVSIAALAWRQDVKVSFHPPREMGTAYPIPPELAPKEVLDAADIDDMGRQR